MKHWWLLIYMFLWKSTLELKEQITGHKHIVSGYSPSGKIFLWSYTHSRQEGRMFVDFYLRLLGKAWNERMLGTRLLESLALSTWGSWFSRFECVDSPVVQWTLCEQLPGESAVWMTDGQWFPHLWKRASWGNGSPGFQVGSPFGLPNHFLRIWSWIQVYCEHRSSGSQIQDDVLTWPGTEPGLSCTTWELC